MWALLFLNIFLFCMVDNVLQQAEAEFKKAFEHLKSEYSHLQVGRASAALVEGLSVDAYGMKQPLKAVGNISIPDPKTIQIQPWDKGLLTEIEKAIRNSDLNLAPVNDGVVIRLNIPPLTEERRKDLAKVVHRLAEEARIAVRHVRQKAHDDLRDMEKNSQITEDQMRGGQKRLQEKVDHINGEIETLAKNKEKDIMTV